jgi:AcrR family transcriptional regulator
VKLPDLPRRAPLDRSRILDAALALVDSEGLENLSTRALGRALGVQAMAIYHHFPSKDALLDALTERLVEGIDLPAPEADPIADLRALLRAYVGGATRHPRAIPLLAGRRFNSAGTLAFLDRVFSAYARAGLSPADIATAFRVQGYFVNGALMAYAATRDADARPDFSLADPAFTAAWPMVAAVIPYLAADRLNLIFDEGLEVVLGVVARLGATGRGPAG